uniref:HMA domain-containing protein n=1 Tax=Kalanchoe fedtschenkoi TaxID=63787 RepID=A0A7N0UH99_KALFE
MTAPSSEAVQQSGPQTQTQKWVVLKVPVDCEGCRKKVTKILHSITGVESCDVDIKQQRVVVEVTGNVDADTLISKLVKKTGKHAELWPEPKVHRKKKPKEKPAQESDQPQNIVEEQQRGVSNEEPPKSNENSEAAVAEKDKEAVREDGMLPEDKKKQKKKAAVGDSPPSAEGNGGEGREKTVSDGSKKKSKGQNGNEKSQNRSQSQPVEDNNHPLPPNPVPPRRPHPATPASLNGPPNQVPTRGLHHPMSPRVNDTSTRAHYAQPPPHAAVPPGYYYTPPQPQPIYTVSYSAAPPPQMSHGRTYYAAAQPANSSSYVYQGAGAYHRPYNYGAYHSNDDQVDYETTTYAYGQQPESFGLFSDENPNACLIM